MSLEQKWSKDSRPLQPVKNENLFCKTCKNKTEKTVSCKIFAVKPVSVLKGGVCDGYRNFNGRG